MTIGYGLRTLGLSAAIPDDYVVPFYFDDLGRRISIARVGGRLYAFDDLCTCIGLRACPLSGGLLDGTEIMCQCHGAWFDITTGYVVSGSARESLRVYPVQEVDGRIQLRT
jgi:3-phenylpropionate/trans-cinnamate dioxygenase ferredoxin component